MKTVFVCLALMLFVISGTECKKQLQQVDPQADSLELIIDVDEAVRIEIMSSSKTASISINTNIEEVELLKQRPTEYIVTKVKKPANTVAPTKKSVKTPDHKKNPKPTSQQDESAAGINTSSFFGISFAIAALISQVGFGDKRWCLAVCALALLCASYTSAEIEAHSVTVRVFLPDNVNFVITQKTGRKGSIDVSGDPASPITVKSFRFSTSTNTELKDIAVSSCESFLVESDESIVVEDLQAPSTGLCNIELKAGKHVFATLTGFLGSFEVECMSATLCSTNAVGSAIKHYTTSNQITEAAAVNSSNGDTLCAGETGYNNLRVLGQSSVSVSFGSSAECPSSSPSEVPEAASPSPAEVFTVPSAAPLAASALPALPASCRMVNGIRWCYNPTKCGEACNDVCSYFGYTITIDDTTWFNAQNEDAKCSALADAFGFTTYNLDTWSYGCLEDVKAVHPDASQLIGPLYCSTQSTCPTMHRTGTDQQAVPCTEASRKSICPCQ